MNFYTKLRGLRAAMGVMAEALDAVLTEWEDLSGASDESEILLTRSTRNRRSEQNQVVTMKSLNGKAPSVPEAWKGIRKSASKQMVEAKAWLSKVLDEYEPMTSKELCALAKEAGIHKSGGRGRNGRNAAQVFYGLLYRMKKAGLLVQDKKGRLRKGKGKGN